MSSLAGVGGSPNRSRQEKFFKASVLICFIQGDSYSRAWDGPYFQWPCGNWNQPWGEGWWVSHCWDQWNKGTGASRDYHEITWREKTKVGWLPRHWSIYTPSTGFWHRQGCPLRAPFVFEEPWNVLAGKDLRDLLAQTSHCTGGKLRPIWGDLATGWQSWDQD